MKIIFGVLLFLILSLFSDAFCQNTSDIMLRISGKPEKLCSDFYYEGNNIIIRGDENDSMTGEVIAKKWKDIAVQTKKIFILRDSMYSQQDHPVKHAPFCLILPPSWIVSALTAKPLKKMNTPPVSDDAQWTAIHSPQKIFGSFPISKSLYKYATMSSQHSDAETRNRILNSRLSLKQLSAYCDRLIKASQFSRQAVIETGAEIICEGDKQYFGTQIRSKHIIPIVVENPHDYETRMGKGFTPPGRQNIPPGLIKKVIRTVLTARMADGDIAIERYDLSDKKEQERAAGILEMVIPKASDQNTCVWLWVTGPMTDPKNFIGKNALRYIPPFLASIKNRDINLSRLRFLSKPDFKPNRATDKKAAILQALTLYNSIDIPLGLNMNTSEFEKIFN